MSFYIERIIMHNRAPFTHFEIELNKNDVCLLSSYNGGGKTTILSHIVDSFHEMARPYYENEYENKGNKFYRVSSDIFNLNQQMPSFFYIRYVYVGDENTKENIDYVDIRGKCDESQYNEAVNLPNKISFNELSSSFSDSRFVKMFSSNLTREKVKRIFGSNILTSFPAYRYESPGYLNDIFRRTNSFDLKLTFSGFLPNPIEVISDIDLLSNWMMDVLIDWQVNKESKNLPSPKGGSLVVDWTPEKINIWDTLNKIINLSVVKHEGENLRLGIGRRTNPGQRISIMCDNSKDTQLKYPTIFNMSTGELAIISIFAEILHQCDILQLNSFASGIVLIDEIDNHLHIKLQKDVLPLLIRMFPNIQFILSSHSPFVGLGLNQTLKQRFNAYSLMNNSGFPVTIQNDILFDEVYKILIQENDNYKMMYEKITKKTYKDKILLVEDKYDQIYKISYLKLKNIEFNKDNLEETFAQHSPFELINDLSASGVAGCLSVRNAKLFSKQTIIGLFDFDKEGSEKFYNLIDGFLSKNDIHGTLETGLSKKKQTDEDSKMFGLMIPVPKRLHSLISRSQNCNLWEGNGNFANFVEIETLLKEEYLSCSTNFQKDNICGKDYFVAKDKKKNVLWEDLIEQPRDIFNDFIPLYKKIFELFELGDFKED